MSEETATPSSPPPLPPSPLEKLNDFPDRFSPMLVKELRQGLRTNTFVALFLILQALLALILLTTAAADSTHSSSVGGTVSGIIFCLFSLAVLIVQPLRGMSAISSEVRGDTIDLMSLTRLSAWRVVFGKWSAITSQTGLILLAIIPYLILRYFFGGMQLFSELLLLTSLFIFSGILTAITVGLSASTVVSTRGLCIIGAFILTPLIIGYSFGTLDELLSLLTPDSLQHWLGLLGAFLISAFVGYFFLELAATAIAPSAENRATRKRLIALLVVTLSFLSLHFADPDIAWTVAILLLLLLSLDLFTESPHFPSVVVRPFLRFGVLGKLAARLLTPGWATGVIFHTFLIISVIALSLLLDEPRELEFWVTFGTLVGILHFPLVLTRLFQNKIKKPLAGYLLFQILSFALFPLFFLLDNIGDTEKLAQILFFIPHTQFFLADHSTPEKMIPLVWIVAGLYLVASLLFSIKPLRALSALEREEEELAQNDPT